jgi:Pregnancy-associated plasma protein-A
MKKSFVFALMCLLMWSCNEDQLSINEDAENAQLVSERQCFSHQMLEEQIAADPTRAERIAEIERFTEEYLRNHPEHRSGSLITIPVVVNVLYRTTAENISDAQIQTQIDVLNADFGATNSDIGSVPSLFTGVKAGDTGIAFELVGINRKSTTKRNWRLNDDMKKSNKGGINPTSPTTTLNMWSCVLASGYLGYAQFPGGPAATDGVVITTSAFGTIGTATAPFNKGRTGTHEVGHWLNLRHIWGDATCGSDLVSDTPTHNTANYGCPAANHPSTCSGTPIEMTMNYMDYTDDACMFMFSQGQETRMAAVFAPGGPRASFN